VVYEIDDTSCTVTFLEIVHRRDVCR